MPGPPTDISAVELFLKLSEPKPSAIYDWPLKGKDGKPLRQFRMMVLSMAEHEVARVEAHRAIKKKYGLKEEDMGGVTMREVAGDAVARQLIAMACRHVQPLPGTEDSETGPSYPRMFRDADHAGELTAHEVLVLFNSYLLTQEKFGPFERGLETNDDLNRWIQRLEEGGSELPLLSISLPHLVVLAQSLQGRITSLYRDLATQWESLPDSLRSTIQSYCGDISVFGSSLGDFESTGSGSYEPALEPGAELDIEDAKRLAERLTKR